MARVVLDDERRIQHVEILEAPSAEISDAVKAAIAQWRFKRPTDESGDIATAAALLTGKVTFYFCESKGQFIVADPSEAPNLAKSDGLSKE